MDSPNAEVGAIRSAESGGGVVEPRHFRAGRGLFVAAKTRSALVNRFRIDDAENACKSVMAALQWAQSGGVNRAKRSSLPLGTGRRQYG
jgi:hypothetical protein